MRASVSTLSRTRAAAVGAVAALSLVLTVGACSSDKDSSSSTSSKTSAASSTTSAVNSSTLTPRTVDAENGPNETIASYIKSAGITETKAKPGEDGAPEIDLPTPDGWETAGDKTPDYAAGAIIYTGPGSQGASYTPNIIALMSKLTGKVDKQKLIDLAGGEMKNLPNFKPMGKGQTSTLSGYPSYKIAGTYTLDGMTAVTAQQTVVIPGPDDAVYVLQFNATSNEDLMDALDAALTSIDKNTKISF
ncbi:MAG: LpqN/LpqT family lipoprotein [Gordonia sp. (in: high G+C Gram-positive bacteria)]